MGGVWGWKAARLLWFVSSFVCLSVWAKLPDWVEEPTLGFEFTFTSPAQEASTDHGSGNRPYSRQNEAALKAAYAKAKEKMGERADISRIQYVPNGSKWSDDYFKITYADGFVVQFTMDPYCLEVIPDPMTLPQLKARKTQIQEDIFDLMESVGLRPKRDIGGGHIHLGSRSAFGTDVRLFRNLIVDTANHTELASGALENDPDNARPFYQMSKEQRSAFERLIWKTDGGFYKTPQEVATAFVSDVFLLGKEPTGPSIALLKYWQLNILRMADVDLSGIDPHANWLSYEAYVLLADSTRNNETAEFRHLRAQNNADEVVWDAELILGRLSWLRKQRHLIPINEAFLSGKGAPADLAPIRYAYYLLESGVNPANYERNIPQRGDHVRYWKKWRQVFSEMTGGCQGLLKQLKAS